MSNLDSYATYLFHEGTNYQAYKLLAPSKSFENGVEGWEFRVWAPNAKRVSVVGDFNQWQIGANPMNSSNEGIWTQRMFFLLLLQCC